MSRSCTLPDLEQFFVPLANGAIECGVCPHHCRLRPGQIGRCGVRVGTATAVEPVRDQGFVAQGMGRVEDHPLFHFHPGMKTLCVGSIGCSAACTFCQNWEIALAPRIDRNWSARPQFDSHAQVIDLALKQGCQALAFTYNEPTIWLEAILELAMRARAAGLSTILVTNGFVTPAALAVLSPHLDAVKLDLKGPDEAFYRKIAGISLAPVLETLRQLRHADVWCEVSTVILPGLNDSPEAVQTMVGLIHATAGAATPWHLMRFFPAYKQQDELPGDLETLRKIRHAALEFGLDYVYISNGPNIPECQTLCPRCQQFLADRRLGRFCTLQSVCPSCGTSIAGVGLAA